MTGIDLLMKEHENIICFTKYLRDMCCNILNGNDVEIQKFYECVEFGRNYADKHHHGKEEKILFRIMLEKLGTAAEKLVRNGMLVEHDLGRYYMGELERTLKQYEHSQTTEGKLDIIAYSCAYADLLSRHIAKEDEVAYTFAERMLSDEDKKKVDLETIQFEEDASQQRIQDKYISWLNKRSSAI